MQQRNFRIVRAICLDGLPVQKIGIVSPEIKSPEIRKPPTVCAHRPEKR
jgi:hypothetical protein